MNNNNNNYLNDNQPVQFRPQQINREQLLQTPFYLEPFQYKFETSLKPAANFDLGGKVKLGDQLSFNNNNNNPGKFNPNEYVNCERNLTKLTVFYSSADKLNCYEVLSNTSLLRCVDDLLETKLIVKLSYFYYVQLQPLFIFKSKMICSFKNGTYLNGSSSRKPTGITRPLTVTASQQQSSTEAGNLMSESSEEELGMSPTATSTRTPLGSKNATIKKLKNALGKTSSSLNLNEYDEVNYLNSYDSRESLSCTLITKKASNRKKLIWKLYLILKNQSCILAPGVTATPSTPARTFNKFVELKNNFNSLDINTNGAKNNATKSSKTGSSEDLARVDEESKSIPILFILNHTF